VVASDADIKYQIADKYNYNDKFLMWVQGKIPFDRMSDKLTNDKVQKLSAYNMFKTQGILQNGLVLKSMRFMFGNKQAPSSVIDNHADFNGVQTHENSVFLYQSNQAKWAVRWGYADSALLLSWSTYLLLGYSQMLLPSLISLAFVPRRWVQQRYFTWHAELIPHTEQVVFHKTFLFGQVERHFVDVKNLEKIPMESIPN